MKKIATTALLVFALLTAQIGQAQTVTTAAKPESPAKKPSPPTEINYTVTEAFPLGDRFIGALNRSGELALVGNFAASFVIRSARSQTLNAQSSPVMPLSILPLSILQHLWESITKVTLLDSVMIMLVR